MQMYVYYWVQIPEPIRTKMREYFNVRHDTSTVVSGGRVQCDGSSEEALKAVTTEKLQELLKSDSTDYVKLVEQAIELFKEKTVEEARVIAETKQKEAEAEAKAEAEEAVQIITEVAKKVAKIGRKKV